MKIEIGYWRTRNGRKARVLCTDAPGAYPIVGYVEARDMTMIISTTREWTNSGLYSTMEWTNSGLYYRESICIGSENDLIEPWIDEPLVPHWQAVQIGTALDASGYYYLSHYIFSSLEKAKKVLGEDVRLATELPPIMLVPK